MSKEKAKEILYKHEEKSGGAINHWQAQWILDAMIEYNESIVKSNIVLGNVSQQRELLLAFTKHMYKQHWFKSKGWLIDEIKEFMESQ